MISVIIAVNNVEKYLDQCLNSIVNQTYTDLEIIAVDDGSTDRCGEILDTWAGKDDRITVIHQQNRGVSAARNAGIEVAHGEYICFADSDDWIHRDMYTYLYRAISENDADVAICHEQVTVEDELREDVTEELKIEREENQQMVISHFMDDFMGPICWPWNKLYRREVIGTSRFMEGKNMEDVFLSGDVLPKAEKVIWIKNRLYYYRQNRSSFCGHKPDKYYIDYGEALVHIDQTCTGKVSTELQEQMHVSIIKRLAVLECEAALMRRKKARKQLRSMFLNLYEVHIPLIKKNKSVYKIYFARYAKHLYYFTKRRMILKECGVVK